MTKQKGHAIIVTSALLINVQYIPFKEGNKVEDREATVLLVVLFVGMLLVLVRLRALLHVRSKLVTAVVLIAVVGMAGAIVYVGEQLVEQDRLEENISRVKQAGLYGWLQVSTPREVGLARGYVYYNGYLLVVEALDVDTAPTPPDASVDPDDVRFFWINKAGDTAMFQLPRSIVVCRPDESVSRPMVRFQFKNIDPDTDYSDYLILSGDGIHWMVNVNSLTVDRVIVRANKRDIKRGLFVPDTLSTDDI